MSKSSDIRDQLVPNPDGEDNQRDETFFMQECLLGQVGMASMPEDAKLQLISYLKDKVFPFMARCEQLRDQESQELKAVFEKYNGTEGLWRLISPESNEMITKITSFGDKMLANLFEAHFARNGPSGSSSFTYGHGGQILYSRMGLEVKMQPKGSSVVELPVINLIPFGADGGVPYHHNLNPDDDHSLNPTLLEVLHRLMRCEEAKEFINFHHERRTATYYPSIVRPRCLSFIEQGLKSGNSIGYGATAFFNDILLIFQNIKKRDSYEEVSMGDILEREMLKVLEAMGSVGEQLRAIYQAIKEQGPETWPDPEIIFFQEPYNPHLPSCDGTKPDLNKVKAQAWDQLKMGQQRVQQLRARLAPPASDTAGSIDTPPVHGGAPPSPKPAKRPREESTENDEDGSARGAKRQRSKDGAEPGPSRSTPGALEQTASKRPREPEDIHGNDGNGDSDRNKAAESRAAKRQRLNEFVAPTSLDATSPGPSDLGSSSAPPQAPSSKRARTLDDADNDGNDQDDGDSHGPSVSKRRRLRKDPSPVGLPRASHEADPSPASRATPEPVGSVPGSSKAQPSSAAGQSAQQHPHHPQHPQPQQQPDQPAVSMAPSSQALPSSGKTVTMARIAKMGKTRPWVFGYSTDEGYGLYAFMKCPGQNCKTRFSSHPLRHSQARDHLLSCGQPVLDEQDMVRQYASQVIKDAGRKSDLTVDWARKSNMTLLPSNEKDNHPDNFPLPSADE